MYLINFGSWEHKGGYFLLWERVFWRGWRWTPFVKIEKRYGSWLGYWETSFSEVLARILGKGRR